MAYNIKEIVEEIDKDIRLVHALRKAGYGKEIDQAYAALEAKKITEDQYWSYIRGLAGAPAGVKMATKNELLIKLEKILSKHRDMEYITCEDTCFCWDIEKFLIDYADEVDYEQHGLAGAPAESETK